MDRLSDRHATATIAFYQDAGVARDVLDKMTGNPVDRNRNLRGLAAIQSLLLSGYTPDSAKRWLAAAAVDGMEKSPIDALNTEGSNAIGQVLAAACARMAV